MQINTIAYVCLALVAGWKLLRWLQSFFSVPYAPQPGWPSPQIWVGIVLLCGPWQVAVLCAIIVAQLRPHAYGVMATLLTVSWALALLFLAILVTRLVVEHPAFGRSPGALRPLADFLRSRFA